MAFWLRGRRTLVRELAGARTLAASLQEQLVWRTEERDAARDALASANRGREAGWKEVAELRALLATPPGSGFLKPVPEPLTPSAELLQARAHAAALEERLHVLQEACMGHDRRP